MIYDRYYYSKLNNREKKAYKKIYAAMENYEPSVTINGFVEADIRKLMSAINFDNPHLFFVDFHYELQSDSFSQTIKLKYIYNETDTTILNKKVKKVCNILLSKVTGKTEFEKELSLHDILARNVLYDDVAKNDLLKFHARSNTILGVLFYKTAVCEGIAKTFKLLLNALDIKCVVVKGKATDDLSGNVSSDTLHAWNMVKIDGKPYHVDLTWDINLSDEKICRHDYLNLPDKDITRDHKFETDYPVCSFMDSNYFYKNNLIVNTGKDVERIIRNAIRLKYNAAEFKLNDSAIETTTDIMAIAGNCIKTAATCQRNLSLSGTCHTEQGICYIEWFN